MVVIIVIYTVVRLTEILPHSFILFKNHNIYEIISLDFMKHQLHQPRLSR